MQNVHGRESICLYQFGFRDDMRIGGMREFKKEIKQFISIDSDVLIVSSIVLRLPFVHVLASHLVF
jgi:hypothetical protein